MVYEYVKYPDETLVTFSDVRNLFAYLGYVIFS